MRTIYVSPEFPLNRRMRKDVRRGKLQVVREGGERSSLGGGIPSGKGRGLRTTGSRLVCMADNGAEVGGGCHPDVAILREVDKTLEKAENLPTEHFLSRAFKKRLELLKDDLNHKAEKIRNHRHTIAFIGTVGHGKTSAICGFTKLLCKSKQGEEPMLLTSAGRTTLCEVRIIHGAQFELVVEPCKDSEVEEYIHDFCVDRFAELVPNFKEGGEGGEIISSEMRRAIHNMARLDTSDDSENSEKKIVEECGTVDKMKEKIKARMILPRRRERIMVCKNLEEMRDGYKAINNGKASKFPLPQRVDVVVPFPVLGEAGQESKLEIMLVDTKGVDPGAFSRPDIERHFNADDTIVVLCSRFNDAPGDTASEVLKGIRSKKVEGNIAEIAAKASIFVLPRDSKDGGQGEPSNTLDESGEPVKNCDEGCKVRNRHVKASIRQLGVGDIPIFFYDWKEGYAWKEGDVQKKGDAHLRSCAFFFDRVESLRAFHRDGLQKLNEAVCDMVENHQKEDFRAQQEEAARRLKNWVQSNNVREIDLTSGCESPRRELLDSISGMPYASSLRAAVNRKGMWGNFDFYHFLGKGAQKYHFLGIRAQETIRVQIEEWQRNFHVIAESVEDDEEVAKARNFVRGIRSWVDNECKKLLVTIYEKSGEIFKTALVLEAGPEATQMWESCRREWGEGPGYKVRIKDHVEKWFDLVGIRHEKLVEEYFLNQWREIQEQLLARLSVEDDSDMDS